MSFGITPQGFQRMLESDLNAEIGSDIAPLFGVDPSTVDWPNTDSPVAQFIKPFCRQLGIVWELAEAAFEGIDPAQAFGTMLDGLLALNNLARLEATSTVVLAVISGTQGAVIPVGTRLSVIGTAALFQAIANATITNAVLLRFNVQVASASSLGTPFTITLNGHAISSGTLTGTPTRDTIALQILAAINASSLVNEVVQAVFYGSAVIKVATVTNLETYTVTLNDSAYSYVSDASATDQEIVDGLVLAINNGQSDLVALGLTSSTFSLVHRIPGSDWSMELVSTLIVNSLSPVGAFAVKSADLKTAFSGSVEGRMAIDKLFSPQSYAAVATGVVEAPSGTLETIETPVTGLTAATNFLDGVLGREVEADDEARIRREETLSTGSAQMKAVISEVKKKLGVTLVRGYENIGDNPDAEGRPGHSVEILVQGGVDLEIAQTIWDTRAAGIKPYGNVNADGSVDPDGDGTGITATDSNGNAQVVHFSRPENRYAFMTVALTFYSEEDFPVNGNDAVKAAIVAFGNALGIGKDLIRQRFLTPIYSIPGIADAVLTVAVSDDPDDLSPSYVSTNIAIDSRQVLVFDTSRISVTP